MRFSTVLTTTFVVAVTVTSLASAQIDEATTLHPVLTGPSYAGCTDPAFDFIDAADCGPLGSASIAGPSFLWFTVVRTGGFPNGIGGTQFGIEHDLGSGLGWALCTGGSEIPEDLWPDSGTGNAMTWADGCFVSPGEHARVGFLSLTTGDAGYLRFTGDPRIEEAVYADCDAALFEICAGALEEYDLASGIDVECSSDYCAVIPVEEMSWGRVKAAYTD